MKLIYEPKGRAREYAELACNLAIGCTHGCTYCYGPASMRMSKEKFHGEVRIKKDVLDLLEADCRKMQKNQDKRYVFLEFASDPFCCGGFEKPLLTAKALQILNKYKLNVNILTKNPAGAFCAIDAIKANPNWKIGTTITTMDFYNAKLVEPNATHPNGRLFWLKQLSTENVYTWISLEPLLYPDQALECIKLTKGFVKEYKIGPLNHSKMKPDIDYRKFKADVENMLAGTDVKLYWKKDYEEKVK